MRLLLLFACLFFTGALSLAQDSNRKIVKSDEEINKVFKAEELFRYLEFLPGKVFFRDGTAYDARLNYHRLYEQMLFIDQKGDSLAIGNPAEIRCITIGSDSFYYSKGNCLELVGTFPSFKLAVKQVVKEVDQQKNGAYGTTYTNNSATANKHYYTVDGKPRLNVGEGTIFSSVNEYYLSYKNNDFIGMNKKNIEKLFPELYKELKAFFKENNINFAKETDVKSLVLFLQSKATN